MQLFSLPSRAFHPAARTSYLLAFTFALAACDAIGTAPPSTYVVRDSAGVRIVESSAPAWQPGEAWTVTPEPVLHIGVVEGAEEYRFTAIGGVGQYGGTWQQSDGTIVAADTGSRQLRRYGSDGTFLNLWGGRGEGPGEYTQLSAAPYRGDSIMGRAPGRYLFYDSQGNLGRTIALDLTEMGTLGDRPFPVASTGFMMSFGDGTFLAMRSLTPVMPMAGEVQARESTFFRYSADGAFMDTIGVYREPDIVGRDPDSPLFGLPFPQQFVFTADETNLYVGSVNGFEVRRVSVVDRSESLFRNSHADLTTTEDHREGYRDATRYLAGINDRDLPSIERALLEVEFPETIPAFSQLMADSEGYLWVRHYKERGSTGAETWSVLAPEGYLLGTVETPERLQVRQIGPDFILGIWTDELDVRFVRKYGLNRGASAP
jgi:hypothetical protein